MISTLLGIKKQMISNYDARQRRVGATVLEIQPNTIVRTKTKASKDGYSAVLLGYGEKRTIKKPQLGLLKKAAIDTPLRYFKEVPGETKEEPGTQINLSQVFSIGDAVKVTGVSKGRGFQGGVKRYHFKGGPKTHGQSDRHRAIGSIGSGTTPGRVLKGKRMAGHMGVEKVSVKNLEVIGVDRASNLLTVKGAVPGFSGGLIMITKLGKIRGYIPPPEEKPDEEEQDSVESQPDQSKLEDTPKQGEEDAS